MAYKFQVGPAQLSGALTQEGTIEVRDPNTGVLVAHATDAGEISASADLKAGGGLDVEGNADIEGQLDVLGSVSLADAGVSTSVRGTLAVVEDASLRANATIGTSDSNTLEIRADVSSSMIPSHDSAFDIGADADRWANIYADTLIGAELSGALKFNIQDGPGIADFTFDNTTNVTVQVSGAADLDPYRVTMWSAGDDKFVNSKLLDDGSSILTLDANYDFEAALGDIKALDGNLSASANIDAGGDLDVEGTGDIRGQVSLASAGLNTSVRGTLGVKQAATFEANVTLGNNNSDRVIFEADVSSSLLPSDDSAFDIGADLERWANIYGDTIVASQLSGALKFNIQDGPGIADFTFDNTTNVTVQVSGAADLDPYRITMWSAGDDKFVNSVLLDDGSSILTLDSGYNFEATSGDIKALAGDISGSGDVDAGANLNVLNGNAEIGGYANITGDLDVATDTRLSGHVTLGGGVGSSDLTIDAAVSSSVYPSHTDTWDLGSSSNRWDEIYARQVRADSFIGNIQFDIQRDNGTFLDATDMYIVTGSASAVTLPAGAHGKVIRVKREASGATASTSDVTLSPATGDSFDDGSPIILETAGAAITCVYAGPAGSGKWFII